MQRDTTISVSHLKALPDATELLRQIRSCERSSEEIVREHLDRIGEDHPRLNAAVQLFREEALAQARKPNPGPLSGLPITLKETFGIAGHEVTIGSVRARPIRCDEDSAPVQRLREAGAIVIARSNVPEFVMNGETDNLRFGRTNNPHDPSRTCGGSSGGEGALVGSGDSPLGFGTDILGSIRIPAAFCGVVGFRPHSGAVDKRGVWPVCGEYFETWNGVGPLTRSVRDARLAYDVIARNPLPPLASPSRRLIIPDGFPLSYRDDCIPAAVTAARESLLDAGLRREEHEFPDVARLFTDIPRLVTGEMIEPWKEWLSAGDQGRFGTGAELLRIARGKPTVYPGFFTWLAMAVVMRPRLPGTLGKIILRYEDARRRYHALLGADGILVLPTLGLLAPKHGAMNRISLRPGVNGLFTAEAFANAMNLSSISVPAHRFADPETGLRPGVMLACAPDAEAGLLDAAVVVEEALSE